MLFIKFHFFGDSMVSFTKCSYTTFKLIIGRQMWTAFGIMIGFVMDIIFFDIQVFMALTSG